MRPIVAVIGSFVVGMSVRLPRLPLPGETLEADLFDSGPGGKGSNAAIAAARLGADVVLIARVGDDLFADMAFELYEQEDVRTRYVHRTPAARTGVGLVYLDAAAGGENTIGLYLGANEQLSGVDVEEAAGEIASSHVVLAQLEAPDEAIVKAMEIAQLYNVPVVLNPAPARAVHPDVLRGADVLTPNLGEAYRLLGREMTEQADEQELLQLGRELIALGPRVVVITLGKDGAFLINQEGGFHVQGYNVEAVDTVGAGDSFNGALAVSLALGKPLKRAIRDACANGALATTQIGAIRALPAKAAVTAFIAEHEQ